MQRSMFLHYLVLVLLWTFGAAAVAQQPPHAILLHGNALVPVRPLAAGVGATVSLDDATRAVTLTRGELTLTLIPYDPVARAGDTTVNLPVPPLLRAGHLFVPARAVATAFGATVELRGGTADDAAKRLAVTYGEATTLFRAVEGGQVLTADLTGDGRAETAFAVANVPGIDAYNSPYLSDLVPLEVWVVQGTRTLWRTSLATGVSVSRFTAPELTGDRTTELLLSYFTRHSSMGPYPGSTYTVRAFGWQGRTFERLLALEYSREHGRLYTEPATLGKAAAFILVDTDWRRRQDSSRYIAELYAWNGRRFPLAARRVTTSPIPNEAAARRLLGLVE
ncbi:MAG TPA: copper amine oxidase N-terminal domain-containing protein [Armatimonadota bacterium]|nr:copper amine oxidase N-terminal domain-containing protein [Armatimonadota bacterium]HOS42887.1 copper amine oxidase N-terminal domain-containing protein [Armatimonadota bacterium]